MEVLRLPGGRMNGGDETGSVAGSMEALRLAGGRMNRGVEAGFGLWAGVGAMCLGVLAGWARVGDGSFRRSSRGHGVELDISLGHPGHGHINISRP